MDNGIELKEKNHQAASYGRIGSLVALVAMALGLSACAGIEAAPREESVAAITHQKIAKSEHQHLTVESAALHALADVWDGTRSWNKDRLRVGSIAGTEGAYTWHEPTVSKSASRLIVRVQLPEDHVATYIIHPRTYIAEINRANELISNPEKRLVDRIDPLHRPIYVLTPSGKVLSYSHGEEVVEVASIPDRKEFRRASGAITVADAASAR